MKKGLLTLLALLTVTGLTACSSASTAASNQSTADSWEGSDVKMGETSENPGTSPKKDSTEQAFGKVLWDAYQKGVLPDGDPLDYNGMDEAVENTFAVTDIDGDGQEELLLFWGNACMAGMVGYVFGFDDGAIHEELAEFPALTFYDNGIVQADWSHNQGLAGDFWPYNVYRYDAENDIYQSFGGADAWDKSLSDVNAEGEPFPAEIDADGDGLVYYILPADWDGEYDLPLVDGAGYESWRSAYLDGAREISISEQKLTENNIAAFGYPKPDVPVPQPQG